MEKETEGVHKAHEQPSYTVASLCACLSTVARCLKFAASNSTNLPPRYDHKMGATPAVCL
jgi:hypothetical protein